MHHKQEPQCAMHVQQANLSQLYQIIMSNIADHVSRELSNHPREDQHAHHVRQALTKVKLKNLYA